jgi:hypothetical protein
LADRLVAAFKATPFTAIASRVGRRDGGYIREMEATSEVLEETLQPFCDDLERRARARASPTPPCSSGSAFSAGSTGRPQRPSRRR